MLDYFECCFVMKGVKVPPGLRRGTTRVSSLKEHIKSLSIDISPTACAAWRKAGCRKRPAQESAAEESEDAETEFPEIQIEEDSCFHSQSEIEHDAETVECQPR